MLQEPPARLVALDWTADDWIALILEAARFSAF